MSPVQIVANGLIVLWLVGEIWQIRRTRIGNGTVRDAGTFAGMWGTILLAVVSSNLLAAWAQRDRSVFGLPFWSGGFGVALLILGVGFRWYSIRALGRYFTVRVTIQDDQALVEHGPYRIIRHPSYLGAWIAFWGIGWVTGTWPALAVWVLLPLIGLLRRMEIEEAVLAAHFGEAYDRYRARTWRLIPWVY